MKEKCQQTASSCCDNSTTNAKAHLAAVKKVEADKDSDLETDWMGLGQLQEMTSGRQPVAKLAAFSGKNWAGFGALCCSS